MLLNHRGTIVDLHIHLLLETFELIDSKLTEIDELIASSSNDSESEFERGEYFIGLGFVAIQQYLVETIFLTKFEKSRAYTLGPKLPGGIPFVSLINAFANWWKHEPEWFNENELKDDAIRTIKRVQKYTDSNDFSLSNVLAYLTNNGVRFTSLTPKIKEWSECIANSE